jgi:hypothetical protein
MGTEDKLRLANVFVLDAESLLAGAEYKVDSRLVLELVRDSNCSAYDCKFIALEHVVFQ